MSSNKISQKIKSLRGKANLTQEDLSRKADVKYTTLTKIESGVIKNPSVQIMAKIARALGTTVEELIK